MPRAAYADLLSTLRARGRGDLRRLGQDLGSAVRESGVAARDEPWSADPLPQIFTGEEWALIERGVRQRFIAFEHFLADAHGPAKLIRHGQLPAAAVLASPLFQRAAASVAPPRGKFLHLGAVALARGSDGSFHVTGQHFGRVHSLARVVLHRRLLAQAAPEMFDGRDVAPVADAPLAVLETLRAAAAGVTPGPAPLAVLLTLGAAAAHGAEDAFLARRLGVPLVQGGDLVVLDGRVFLKTIAGLERVHAILSSVPERLLDPLALEAGSVGGVAGLVHCLRRGSVALLNGLGSQLADDRALLPFARGIVRACLGEEPVLPDAPTHWLGDSDRRAAVLGDLAAWRIIPRSGDARRARERPDGRRTAAEEATLRREIRRAPHLHVAQPADLGAETVCFEDGREVLRRAEHFVVAVRRPDGEVQVLPGAFTRIGPGAGKDTWAPAAARLISVRDAAPADRAREVLTSRVAESFYWLGRYLERVAGTASLLLGAEQLEAEELSPAERRLCRPLWNALLPRLEGGAGAGRGVAARAERGHLVLDSRERGSLAAGLARAGRNADAVRNLLSPEAAAALADLRDVFSKATPAQVVPVAHFAAAAQRGVAAFFGLAEATMPVDDALRFCRLGRHLERAVFTANALPAFALAFMEGREAMPRLSALLRLLGARDAYRRLFQRRAEGLPVLDFLLRDPASPRSLARALGEMRRLLGEIFPGSPAGPPALALAAVGGLLAALRAAEGRTLPSDEALLRGHFREIARQVAEIHNVVADCFLNHQARLAPPGAAPRRGIHARRWNLRRSTSPPTPTRSQSPRPTWRRGCIRQTRRTRRCSLASFPSSHQRPSPSTWIGLGIARSSSRCRGVTPRWR